MRVDRTATEKLAFEAVRYADERPLDIAPSDLLDLMWSLTVSVWSFKEPNFAESRLSRDAVNIVRSKR